MFGKSVFAAVLGLVGPIGFAFLVMSAMYPRNWQAALSVGAAIAPTSFGFSAKLFMEVGELDTPLARIACSAAVIDDMLSLVLLSGACASARVFSLVPRLGLSCALTVCCSLPPCVEPAVIAIQNSHVQASAWTYAAPVVGCFGSITVGILLCVYGARPLLAAERCIPAHWRGRVMLVAVLATGVGAGLACRSVKTSELLGCYFTGLLFSSSEELKTTWPRQMKRIVRWGSALFFAGTIGFSVPSLSVLFSPAAASRGILLLLAAALGKSFVGFFTSPLTCSNVCKFAAAMNARGEFNFQVTAMAYVQGVITSADSAALTWALLLLTLFTPIWFRLTFSKRHPDELQHPPHRHHTVELMGHSQLHDVERYQVPHSPPPTDEADSVDGLHVDIDVSSSDMTRSKSGTDTTLLLRS